MSLTPSELQKVTTVKDLFGDTIIVSPVGETGTMIEFEFDSGADSDDITMILTPSGVRELLKALGELLEER